MAVVECMKVPPLKLGEAPHWKADDQCLYLVDTTGSIVQHSPKTNRNVIHILGERISFIVPVKGRDNEFIIGKKADVELIKWDTQANKIIHQEKIISLENEAPTSKINDGKCDARGRLWFGTLTDRFTELESFGGSFYSYSKSEGLVKRLPKVGLSNGMGFSPDNKKMYYIDSMTYKVDQYDFDINRGSIKLKKTVIDFKKAHLTGMPDGMTVDSKGNLWIACILGSHVIQVDPDKGKILRTVKFAKSNVITSVAFGGAQLDELFVTSGNIPEKTINAPEAGCTFRVTGHGSTGLLPYEFDLDF